MTGRAIHTRVADEDDDRWMALPMSVRYQINLKATEMRRWIRARKEQA